MVIANANEENSINPGVASSGIEATNNIQMNHSPRQQDSRFVKY